MRSSLKTKLHHRTIVLHARSSRHYSHLSTLRQDSNECLTFQRVSVLNSNAQKYFKFGVHTFRP